MLHWLERNVLSVGDYTWAREPMKLLLPDGTHHLYEAAYEYDMSVTADTVELARRANTWQWNY
eukprot:2161207-Prymnesium_polylepis.2